MKLKVTGAVLGAGLIASLSIPVLLHLKGNNRWLLTAALSLLAILASAFLLWLENRKQAPLGPGPRSASAAGNQELANYLSEAETKLIASKGTGGRARLGNLPVILVLGPQGAAKTTTIVQSAIEPELLAGQVYGNDQIVPTRLLNIWFARQSVLVEPAASVVADPARWSALIRHVQPGKLGSALTSAQPPRSAVVMLDCERLYNSGGNGTLAGIARELHTQLGAISRQLGIAVPVYVLFTKADRVPFFQDYLATLNDAEASQPLGVALPLTDANDAAPYEEAQTARISQAFDQLYYSLAEKRLVFLAREIEGGAAPSGYEFPRELRRLRPALTQFLVDLCRPSQLSVNPFLRGFYFVGVRPLIVREAVHAPQRSRQSPKVDAGATAIFRPGQSESFERPSQTPEFISRRVPQWVFLRRLFPDVVLADDSGLRQSGASVKTHLFRRLLLAGTALLCAVFLMGATVAFINNRALESQVRTAAADINASQLGAESIPSVDSLRKLDHLRESLETISEYNRTGAPLSYRLGLYVGNELLPKARNIYFARFRQLLFSGIDDRLVASLKSLPPTPGPLSSYGTAYNALKSYLITTVHHEKSTAAFLSPELDRYWQMDHKVDGERLALARRQFDFYANELRFENPYSSENDHALIDSTRSYLGQFAGTERVYRNMLTDIEKNLPPVSFKGPRDVVSDSYSVPGAFTTAGFAQMADAIKHVNKYFAGEPWVLESQSVSVGDLAKLESDIQGRYTADYIGEWRKYLNAAQVIPYSSIPDAARKLRVNSAPESPLLGILCLASENTDADPALSRAFAPLHKAVAPACSTSYISAPNADYMKNLAGLQVSLEQIGTQKPDTVDPIVAAAASTANQAKTSVIQLAQSLGIDGDGHIEGKIERLLEAPIKYTDPLLKGLAPAAINGKGAGLCAEMRPLLLKFPFNAQASQEASLAEINAIFKPVDGSLWKFYDANLSKSLTRIGEPISGGGFTYSARFLSFFRRAAAFSNAAYAAGPDPKLEFVLRPVSSEDIQSLRLNIDGTTAEFPAGSSESHKFSWPGTASLVSLSGVSKSTGTFTRPYDGPWAVFHFFADANRAPPSGVGVFEWDQKFGLAARTVQIVKLDLNMGSAPPVFQRGYFAGLSCVADIASPK